MCFSIRFICRCLFFFPLLFLSLPLFTFFFLVKKFALVFLLSFTSVRISPSFFPHFLPCLLSFLPSVLIFFFLFLSPFIHLPLPYPPSFYFPFTSLTTLLSYSLSHLHLCTVLSYFISLTFFPLFLRFFQQLLLSSALLFPYFHIHSLFLPFSPLAPLSSVLPQLLYFSISPLLTPPSINSLFPPLNPLNSCPFLP